MVEREHRSVDNEILASAASSIHLDSTDDHTYRPQLTVDCFRHRQKS